MSLNGFGEDGLENFAGPEHWNDPDMLEVGNGKMSHDEYVTHMSPWCILNPPLLAETNLSRMTPETLAILTSPEIVALDQDSLGTQAPRIHQEGPLEVWMKPLSDGAKAVAPFNRGETEMPLTVSFGELGIRGQAPLRELWARKDLGVFQDRYTRTVPFHGAVVLKVRPTETARDSFSRPAQPGTSSSNR